MTPAHQHSNTEDVWGQKIASHLDEAADSIPHEILERLKVARVQAVSKRVTIAPAELASSIHLSNATATLSGGHAELGLWRFLAAWAPLLVLIAGLLTVFAIQDEYRAQELADVDSELLTDELPPAAFTDPGFTQFLKTDYVP